MSSLKMADSPLRRPDRWEKAESAGSERADRQKSSILIVDDNRAKCLAMASVLEELDQNLVIAESGREALRLLLKSEFAVILLDVRMPEMSGFETAALIRSRKQSELTPIIFVTAYAPAEIDMLQGYALGAVDYISSPIVPEILRAKVSVFVDLYHKTREIEQQSRELREKNLELEASKKELEAFSYSISHDLRAPLRHINGYASILAEEAEDQLSAVAKRYLQSINRASRKMGQLIDDLLSFSRMSCKEMLISRIDLNRLVQEVVHDPDIATGGRDIQWDISPLPVINGDRAMMRQVFTNLISNAIKYTEPKKTPRIEIGCSDEEDGKVVLYVRDNGVGFDMQYSDKLFGVFQRLHREDEFEGTGIGLANVRRIIMRHSGRTWAEGKLDQGATIYFTVQQADSS